MEISRQTLNNEMIKRVEEISCQNLFLCYQCGKCSAGCPVHFEMDILPNQIMRLLQIGSIDDILSSKAILLCATCFMCLARCPKGIDVSAIMDALKFIKQTKDKDVLSPKDINNLSNIPQQALVGIFRKLTGQ